MQARQIHWASTLTLIVLGIGVFLFFTISIGAGAASLFNLFGGESDPAGLMIASFAFGFEAAALGLCAWFVAQKARGLERADEAFEFPFAAWQIPAVIALVVFVASIGGAITLAEIAWLGWLTLPALTLSIIVPPIWVLFGIGTRGIGKGPRWRFFAILGLSMTLAPAVITLFEFAAALLLAAGGAVYLTAAQPALLDEMLNIVSRINAETSPEALLNLLAPVITNPALIAAGIGYIAVIVPLIEEALKPLAIWLFAKQIESPAQGLALGMLCGAGFAMFESLNASADGTINWSVIVSARAGTSLLHLFTSGLVGWGIVSAFRQGRFGRLAAAYFAAVLIHGVWNAAAIGAGLSAIGESVGRPEWLFNLLPALLCALLVMGIGMFAVLAASNRRLRREDKE
jgi:hypothetical protein